MKWCITLCGPSRELPQKNQSIHVEIQNKGFFWHVLGLFRLFLRCSWLVLGLFRLFLACSWVVQVVLGLFRGVPSFSNDGNATNAENLTVYYIPCCITCCITHCRALHY